MLPIYIRSILFAFKGSFVFSFRLFGRANQLSVRSSNCEPNDHNLLHSSTLYPHFSQNTSISQKTMVLFSSVTLFGVSEPKLTEEPPSMLPKQHKLHWLLLIYSIAIKTSTIFVILRSFRSTSTKIFDANFTPICHFIICYFIEIYRICILCEHPFYAVLSTFMEI